MPHPKSDAPGITQLLAAWRDGDRGAVDRLMPLVYDELHAIARGQGLRAGADRTLQTTALVHEAYLKLANRSRLAVQDRHHFFAIAAKAMRQLAVDYARKRSADKRGAGVTLVVVDEVDVPAVERAPDIVALDEALERLARIDEPLSRLVELRYFAGLSVEETAQVLGCSARTVKRDWRKARALLHADLTSQRPPAR
jgi:RNA polymerase sigma factor (TIGR02999 family)